MTNENKQVSKEIKRSILTNILSFNLFNRFSTNVTNVNGSNNQVKPCLSFSKTMILLLIKYKKAFDKAKPFQNFKEKSWFDSVFLLLMLFIFLLIMNIYLLYDVNSKIEFSTFLNILLSIFILKIITQVYNSTSNKSILYIIYILKISSRIVFMIGNKDDDNSLRTYIVIYEEYEFLLFITINFFIIKVSLFIQKTKILSSIIDLKEISTFVHFNLIDLIIFYILHKPYALINIRTVVFIGIVYFFVFDYYKFSSSQLNNNIIKNNDGIDDIHKLNKINQDFIQFKVEVSSIFEIIITKKDNDNMDSSLLLLFDHVKFEISGSSIDEYVKNIRILLKSSKNNLNLDESFLSQLNKIKKNSSPNTNTRHLNTSTITTSNIERSKANQMSNSQIAKIRTSATCIKEKDENEFSPTFKPAQGRINKNPLLSPFANKHMKYLPNNISQSQIFNKDNESDDDGLLRCIFQMINGKDLINNNDKNEYMKLGEFVNQKSNIYYKVYIKYIKKEDEKAYLIDILLYDITEYYNELNTITEGFKIKENALAHSAHEFKTPLNAVIITSQNIDNILLKSKSNLKSKDIIIIKEQITLLKNISHYTSFLVTDFTQATKKIKENQLNIEEVPLITILDFCYNILIVLIQFYDKTEKNQVIPILDIDDDIKNISLMIDEIKFKQVLINFISNSVKFTKKGHIRINAYKTQENLYKINIEDTGIGLSEVLLSEIRSFNFENIQIDTINNKSGSGYGLNIAFTLLKKFGFSFDISSNQNKGTIISIGLDNVIYNKNNEKGFNIENSNQSVPASPLVLIADKKESNFNYLTSSIENNYKTKNNSGQRPTRRRLTKKQVTKKINKNRYNKSIQIENKDESKQLNNKKNELTFNSLTEKSVISNSNKIKEEQPRSNKKKTYFNLLTTVENNKKTDNLSQSKKGKELFFSFEKNKSIVKRQKSVKISENQKIHNYKKILKTLSCNNRLVSPKIISSTNLKPNHNELSLEFDNDYITYNHESLLYKNNDFDENSLHYIKNKTKLNNYETSDVVYYDHHSNSSSTISFETEVKKPEFDIKSLLCYLNKENKEKSNSYKDSKYIKLNLSRANSKNSKSISHSNGSQLSPCNQSKYFSNRKLKKTLSKKACEIINEEVKDFKGYVLVVDDMIYVRKQQISNLEKIKKKINGKFGIKVGYDGINVLSSIIEDNKNVNDSDKKIKLVLCDNNMTYIYGYVVASLLKMLSEEEKIREIPILVCTTEATENEEELLYSHGFDFVTQKFPNDDELMNLLKKSDLI